jgi:hypothetical protein
MVRHRLPSFTSTEFTALMSKVVANGNEFIKFPINEPAKGKKKSVLTRLTRPFCVPLESQCYSLPPPK